MREILLTSSVLIAALLVLRKVFQKTISRRAQYALWGLVVLRLLVPVNLPALHYNVLTAAEPVQTQVAARLERQTVALPVERAPLDQHPEARDAVPDVGAAVTRPAVPAASDGWVVATDTTAVRYRQLTAAEILTYIWYAGMAVMAVWFLLTANLRFAVRLRRSRRPYPVEGCKYPVYLAAASAVPLSVRAVAPRGLPDPRRRGIPGDPAARSDPRDHPRPPSGPPVEPAAVRVSGGILVRSAGVDRRRCLPPGLRAGLRRGCAETAGGGGTHPLWPDAAAADPRSPDGRKALCFPPPP